MDLPRPTTDLAQARHDLAVSGYCVVAEALTPRELDALRIRLNDQAAGEDAVGAGFHDGGANQRIWMLTNKGQAFCDLVTHPITTSLMSGLLGENFLLSSLTANIARPGGVEMVLHTDQGYAGAWTPEPLVANIAWMLDPFTDENGATRVVPGSHLRPVQPGAAPATVAATGPAGAALVFDGRLVHGTGANRTQGEDRRAILSYFCRPFIRQQENFFLGLDEAVLDRASPMLLERLGYRIWAGLGRTDSPADAGFQRRLERPLGALTAMGQPA